MAMANDRVHPRKRKKVCSFCVDKVAHIDFKDTAKLRRYLSEQKFYTCGLRSIFPVGGAAG